MYLIVIIIFKIISPMLNVLLEINISRKKSLCKDKVQGKCSVAPLIVGSIINYFQWSTTFSSKMGNY